MVEEHPHLIVIAGPNGAGKSTSAPALLQGTLGVTEYVNADTIAQGLSAFAPERAAFRAGRIMLERLQQLANARVNFAFETTLASRSFAPWIANLRQNGYRFHLFFLGLPNPELAIARVQERVSLGGHDVPEETIRRRYHAGIRNFFQLYRPLADSWFFYDNASMEVPRLLAAGEREGSVYVAQPLIWQRIEEDYYGR
ncbi:MAG: zeta toxin family protein [Coleofasciculus chthonoplastes F3-SA18-01]|uniref:zeta toxin family protein n=1 Tax=Coleofasciculus chthonoplastes TaxID=64178 RepID=UPI0032FB9FC4